jgi:hypothetical protein
MRGEDFAGKKPTVGSTVKGLTTAISLQNIIDLKDDASVGSILGVFTDLVGIGANTYSTKTDWSANPGVELKAFLLEVGDKAFKEANAEYDKRVEDWFKEMETNPDFQALSDDDKKKVITSKKSKLKDQVFFDYNFRYRAPQTNSLPNF